MRRWTLGAVALMVLVGAFVASGVVAQPVLGGGCVQAESARGFVRLGAAMRGHPMWGELSTIEKEIEARRVDWECMMRAAAVVERDIEACYEAVWAALSRGVAADGGAWSPGPPWHPDIVASALERVRARLEAEAREVRAAYEVEVRTRLDEDLWAERARLDREFGEFREAIVAEYCIPLMSARLKLAVADMDDHGRQAAESEFARLSAEMQSRLDVRRAELDSSFAAYAERRRAQAEADLEAFRMEQERATAMRLEQERARLETELSAILAPVEASGRPGSGGEPRPEETSNALTELSARRERLAQDHSAMEAAFAAGLQALQSRRDGLATRIRADVETAARGIGEDLGLVVEIVDDVTTGVGSPSGGTDLTEDVLAILRRQ